MSPSLWQADDTSESLSVTWPVDNMAYISCTTKEHVIGKNSITSSLDYSVRVLLAGEDSLTGKQRRHELRTYHDTPAPMPN